MLGLRTKLAESHFCSKAETTDIAALSASDEAAAVVAGYRALQADGELHQHGLGSAARTERMLTVLTPVADAWGISVKELINAVGRGVE